MRHVLFVDVRNTARSRMAEVWFNRLAAGWGKAESCGTMPAGASDPCVTQVMREVGVPIPERTPRAVKQQLLARAEVIVILGKELNAQAFAAARVWDLPDPTHQPLSQYRLVRDAIYRNVEELIVELRARERESSDYMPVGK